MKKRTFTLGKRGTFFFKYFTIFSSIVLVSFLIIGSTLMVFITRTLTSQVLDKTKNNVVNLAQMTAEILDSDAIKNNPQGVAITLCKNVEILSECTGYDVYICDAKGNVIICPETLSGMQVSNINVCDNHKNIQVPLTYLNRVKTGEVSEISKLNGVYENYHSVSMAPFYVNNSYRGFCVVSAPVTGTIFDYIQKTFVMFVVTAAIALVLVTIAVALMTERIAKPIRNLENATKCYSVGDFSYRVPELDTNDELAALITKFNAMANSLAQLENSRRSFVANVSHEFKTPMTTIGGFINGILDGTIPPEKQDYYLNIVSSEISRLSKMVTTMLNISKIETGNVEMNMEKIDVSQKLVTTFLGFEQLISKKKIEICGLEDLEQSTIHGDSSMIDQVVYNLVDNAVKFTNEGGRISVNTASDKNNVYFAITNSGKGIPEKDISKVFERFYKVDQSRSTDVKSTGLGLYLIKSIVELHNGTVTVESKVDNFTRFTVKLPR